MLYIRVAAPFYSPLQKLEGAINQLSWLLERDVHIETLFLHLAERICQISEVLK